MPTSRRCSPRTTLTTGSTPRRAWPAETSSCAASGFFTASVTTEFNRWNLSESDRPVTHNQAFQLCSRLRIKQTDRPFESGDGEHGAVRRELHGRDEPGGGGAFEFLAVVLEVPDDDPPVEAAPGARLTVRRNVERADSAQAEFSSPHFATAGQVPDPDGIVHDAGDDLRVVIEKTNVVRRLPVSLENQLESVGRQIPDGDRAIRVGTGQMLAVVRETQAADTAVADGRQFCDGQITRLQYEDLSPRCAGGSGALASLPGCHDTGEFVLVGQS